MAKKKKETPLWKQYGFESEKEFLRKYPHAGKRMIGRHTTNIKRRRKGQKGGYN